MIREVLLILLLSLPSVRFADAAVTQTTSSSTPAIALRPSATTAGATIDVSGSGFTPNWTAWVFSPDFGDQMCCFMTSSTGSFEVNYTLPSDLQPGVYTIRGVDQKGIIADAKITVVSQTTSTSPLPEFAGSAPALVLFAVLIATLLCSTRRPSLQRCSATERTLFRHEVAKERLALS